VIGLLGLFGAHFPLPLRTIVCGEPGALSVIVRVAVAAPPASGAKWPWIVQFAPAASIAPQLFSNENEAASAPVTPMSEMVWLVVPVFIKDTNCKGLDFPTSTGPKDRVVAESATLVVLTPVPDRATDCGEPGALSIRVRAAVIGPKAAGVKCPWIMQVWPAARVDPQLFAKTNEDASLPVTSMLEMDIGKPVVFVKYSRWEPLCVPTTWVSKDKVIVVSMGTETVCPSCSNCAASAL